MKAGAHLAKSQGGQKQSASAGGLPQGQTRAAGGTAARRGVGGGGNISSLQCQINLLNQKVTLHKRTLGGDLQSGDAWCQPC